jgi:hypothetical protein
MSRQLFTSWTEYQAAADRVLALATRSIRIYDEDLAQLHLESDGRTDRLREFLAAGHPDSLRIALRNSSPLRQRQPLTMSILARFSHIAHAKQTAGQLAHLRDSMVIVDERHAVIRFDRDQPRSKLLEDDPDEVAPYLRRFNEIWDEGGDAVGPTTLGL